MTKKVLFVPLNTNHVIIFEAIIASLRWNYQILCHDRISEGKQYFTEEMLKQKGLSYFHFPHKIQRAPTDILLKKIIDFFRIKIQIRKILKTYAPAVIIFAIDNDPISQIAISEAKKKKIITILIPEGLIQYYDLFETKTYFSAYLYKILRFFGIYLDYVKYGAGGCDHLLVSGRRAFDILKKSGLPENKMTIVGQPKYDAFLNKILKYKPPVNQKKIFLFAASKRIFKDDTEISLLRKIIGVIKELNLDLLIKLHPRTPETPTDLEKRVGLKSDSSIKVIKEGYDTFNILEEIYAIITIPSAIILEALLMDKECIIISYMQGESFTDYVKYDAMYFIYSEDEIDEIIRESTQVKKKQEHKIHLLEDELYMLDGKASIRIVEFLSKCIYPSDSINRKL